MNAEAARDIDGVGRAQERLAATLAGLGDARRALNAPSRLPGWTLAHVLGHLIEHAESLRRVSLAAGRGEAADRYPGGRAQRDAAIEEAAARPAAELLASVQASGEELVAVWRALPDAAWEVVAFASGVAQPLRGLPFRRWREVELHHVDLGLGYEPTDWPSDYVRLELRNALMAWRADHSLGLTQLPPAALALAPHERLAWLAGRADVPGLAPPSPWF